MIDPRPLTDLFYPRKSLKRQNYLDIFLFGTAISTGISETYKIIVDHGKTKKWGMFLLGLTFAIIGGVIACLDTFIGEKTGIPKTLIVTVAFILAIGGLILMVVGRDKTDQKATDFLSKITPVLEWIGAIAAICVSAAKFALAWKEKICGG